MTNTWRFLDLPTDSYAESTMALSPALAKARKENLVPDTAAVFSFRGPSVVMGYYISPDQDVDLDFCRRNGIVIKRIPTQGVIFGHEGYILTGLYIHRRFLPEDMPGAFRKLNEAVARRIQEAWGIPARHRPLNDLEIEIQGKWKKIGPQSLTFDGEIAVQRLGLTISPLPMHLVEKAIVPPPEKFADKEAKSVSERVGSLEEAIGRPVSISEAKGMMMRAVEDAFGVSLLPGKITDTELEFRRSFVEQYDKEEWFFAKSALRRFAGLPPDSKISQFVYKVSGGPLIRVNLCVREGTIFDILFTGNLQPSRREIPEELEQALRGAPAQDAAVAAAILRRWEEKQMVVAGARAEDFTAAVSGALKRIE